MKKSDVKFVALTALLVATSAMGGIFVYRTLPSKEQAELVQAKLELDKVRLRLDVCQIDLDDYQSAVEKIRQHWMDRSGE